MSQSTKITPAQRLAVKQALQFAETNPISVEQFQKVVNYLFTFYTNQDEFSKQGNFNR